MATVLIVDNASFMRSSLKYIMEMAGHHVIGMASDGNEAIVQFQKLHPDIVTMDIIMENMNGIDALREIKHISPSAKVIMVTALGHEEKEDEAKKLGAAGYIKKPFKIDEITKEINRVVKEA